MIPLILGCLVTAGFVGIGAYLIRNALEPEWSPMDGYVGPDAVFVACLSVGIDWRLRGDFAARLSSEHDTPHERVRRAVEALRAERGWLYLSLRREPGSRPKAAATRIEELAREKAAVPGDAGAGAMLFDGPARGRPLRGEGVAVLHVLVVTRRETRRLAIPSGESLRATLDDLDELEPDEVVQSRVLWTPTDGDLCLPVSEVAQRQPDLHAIDPRGVADRVFCSRCRFPFAVAETECAHCGAPV